MASEDQLKNEIARLTASINQHKSQGPSSNPHMSKRNNSYVNPNYKGKAAYLRPHKFYPSPKPKEAIVKDVVLGGVAFESSIRSLIRKDLVPVAKPQVPPTIPIMAPQAQFSRKSGHLVATSRVYKPKSIRGRASNRNMTLANNRRPYQSRRQIAKRLKYMSKPCPRFTTTGACSRALTCMYQHDPSKIAICWNFLQGNCPNDANTCNLSHDPTPQRTPLCVHFLNKGRCNRDNCPYPHINVGPRQGVCRDFAVLGYCEKGLECDKQHIRECPDFAEGGSCSTKGCKLPHVIRANRNRKGVAAPTDAKPVSQIFMDTTSSTTMSSVASLSEESQIGDEYVSLMFNESDTSDEESEEDVDEEMAEEEEDLSDFDTSNDAMQVHS